MLLRNFAVLIAVTIPFNAQAGRFLDDLIVKVLRDGETLELVSKFSFEDDQKRIWSVPKGAHVNGASIPRALWTMVGSPFRGKYREASVIHDYFCVNKRRPWQQTHRVFYDAMLANGVGKNSSKLFYFAVYRFGPRWDFSIKGHCKPGHRCIGKKENDYWEHTYSEFQPRFDDESFKELRWRLSDKSVSDDDLRNYIDRTVLIEATEAYEAAQQGK